MAAVHQERNGQRDEVLREVNGRGQRQRTVAPHPPTSWPCLVKMKRAWRTASDVARSQSERSGVGANRTHAAKARPSTNQPSMNLGALESNRSRRFCPMRMGWVVDWTAPPGHN